MKEFKIGGKVTLEDNLSYRIVDIIKKDDKEYFFCCVEGKPNLPRVFERKDIDGKAYIKFVDDPKILKSIALTILN